MEYKYSMRNNFPLTHNFPADLAILTLNKQKKNSYQTIKIKQNQWND